jgi:hypothetical protein
VSEGKATANDAATYYIDFENGNDNWDGKSPLAPWKTFRKVNANTKKFNPGDHILLEADSIWNGTAVNKNNYRTLLSSANVGMLAPKGNGTAAAPIVIDLYDIKYTKGSGIVETYDSGCTAATVYWSANQRPVINGNGTPSLDSGSPYAQSGVIHIKGQDYWHINNIEVTNSFEDFSNPAIRATHWYQKPYSASNPGGVIKGLVGIFIEGGDPRSGADDPQDKTHPRGHIIKNCYAHDIQSEHNNNQGATTTWNSPANDYFGPVNISATGTAHNGKAGGGIMVLVTDSTVEGNIVKRTEYMGIRTNHGDTGYNVNFIGNYIETVFGDGMVTSRVGKQGGSSNTFDNYNRVEHNIIKDACAAPNHLDGNYAANWCYYGDYILYQFNETYGNLYGYLDGEAWDIDNASDNVVYQYNYSHHNAGGAVLFMNDISNGVFRYNISANDGGSSGYMYNLTQDGNSPADALPVSQTANSYTAWNNHGQSLIHYVTSGANAAANIPAVYNNTFYIGDGISLAIYGNTSSGQGNKYVRFYNNILLKEGAGVVKLSDTHNPGGNMPEGTLSNAGSGGFKNNLLWAPAQTQFTHGNSATTVANLLADGNSWGNKWADPQLKIQQDGDAGKSALRAQRDTVFPEGDVNDPAALSTFTGTARLRTRAAMFAPVAGSPVIGAGMTATEANMDSAWIGPSALTEDFFGNAITGNPPIGAAAGPYTGPAQ